MRRPEAVGAERRNVISLINKFCYKKLSCDKVFFTSMYSKRNIARGCVMKMRYWRETSPPPPSPPPPSPTPDPVDPSIPTEKPAINYAP